jgi:chromosomal replication initiator protein
VPLILNLRLRAGGIPVKSMMRALDVALGQAIAHRIGEPRYQLWFAHRTKFSWNEDVLTIGVPNRHFEEWLEKTFHRAVSEAAAEVFNKPMQVRYRIDPELFRAARQEQEEAKHSSPRFTDKDKEDATHPSPPSPRQATSVKPPRPEEKPVKGGGYRTSSPKRKRRWLHLRDFVVGSCNRVAHASALSVVEGPGEGPNPLVLYGPVGTGKTHLLEGIYTGCRRGHSDWRICYVTSEDFTNRFVQAMRLGKIGGFRRYFRECDVLLVDDLHFLASKRATQEEFLHTFDALQSDGRQVVVTCDCHPRLADDFTPELTDRLLGGAVWGLSPPEQETRLGILRARAAQDTGTLVPDEVLIYLAEHLRGNARELEGALHSIRHFSRVTGRPVNIPLVREALVELLRHAVRVVQLPEVDRAMCQLLGLEAGTLQSRARAWAVSHPRMLAMFLARKHTAHSYGEIGAYFGGRNHSTVVAAEKKVRGWLAKDADLPLGSAHPSCRVRDLLERVERDLFR